MFCLHTGSPRHTHTQTDIHTQTHTHTDTHTHTPTYTLMHEHIAYTHTHTCAHTHTHTHTQTGMVNRNFTLLQYTKAIALIVPPTTPVVSSPTLPCPQEYSGTPLLWTPWGPGKVSCKRGVLVSGVNLY